MVTTDTLVTRVGVRQVLQQWYPLALVFLAIGLGTAMAYPFQALFLTSAVHASPLYVTIFLAASPLSSVLVSTVIGRLSDTYPIRQRVLIGAALAGALSTGIFAVVRNYWVLLALTVTVTAAATAGLPQAFAYARVALQGSADATRAITTLRTLFSVAWVGGPPLAAVLVDAGGFTAVYAVATAMYLAAAVFAAIWLREPRTVAAPPTEPPTTEPRPTTQPGPVTKPEATEPDMTARDVSRAVLWLTLVAFVFLQGGSNLGVQSLPLFIKGDLGGHVSDAGLILGVCAALEIPLMLGFASLSTRMPLRRLILAGPLFSIAYFAAAAAATHTWHLGVSQLLNAASISVIQGLGISYVQDLMPRHPGRASTLYSNAFPAGAVLAGPLLGVAADVGYRWSYLVAALLSLGGLALLLIARPPHRVVAIPTPATINDSHLSTSTDDPVGTSR